MSARSVTGIMRRPGGTILRLDCGHERWIGGHVLPNGIALNARAVAVGGLAHMYDCQDGRCYSGGAPDERGAA